MRIIGCDALSVGFVLAMRGKGACRVPSLGMCTMNRTRVCSGFGLTALKRSALIVLGAASLAGFSVRPLAGQQAGARELEDVLPAQQVARIREIAREAREAGVPAGLIVRKAFEGAAKGYPPERIVTALDAYAGRLRDASALLGPERRPSSVAAAAEALRRGVPPDAIRSMATREHGGRDLAVPLIVLSDLTEAGVPTQNALEMVNGAIDRGARGDRMLGLSAAVRRRMRQGADWRTAVDAVRRRAERQYMQRDRRRQGDRVRPRDNPSRRPMSSTPIPPGSDPPHRLRDGG